MSDYTPTTDDVRHHFTQADAEFDRWLDNIIQKAKAQGWDECGEKLYGNLLYPETETYLRNPYREK